MCAALKVTRQGYYAWRSRPPSAHAVRDAELAELISQVRAKVRNIYGAPKTFMRLRALGVRTSRKRVARIMRERGWRGVTRACAKRPSGEKRASKRESAADLVGRRFEADGPDMAWFADITYVKTRQGWLHLALVMDIWSRRVVGWSMGPNITAELADDALKMALARRNPPEGCVHHSDHGSQYVSLLLSKTMRERGIRPSMGSISSTRDNAAMKSLMGIVKSECVHAQTYATREEAALDLFEYIEVVCNRARIHSALGYLNPVEFEGPIGPQTKAARRRRKGCQRNRGRFRVRAREVAPTRSGRGFAFESGIVVRFLTLGVHPRIPSSRINLRTLYRVRLENSSGRKHFTDRKPNLRSDSSHTRRTASRSAGQSSRGQPLESHE